MGAGQTDLQVGLQVHTSCKKHTCTVDLCWVSKMLKNVHQIAGKYELNQSQRKSTFISGWPNEMQVELKSKTSLTCESLWPGTINLSSA